MKLLTPKKIERLALYDRIATRYEELAVDPENQKMAIIQFICDEMGVGRTTIYKARQLRNIGRRSIDRVKLIDYHNTLMAQGVSSPIAKRMTALKYGVTTNYVYQIIKMATS